MVLRRVAHPRLLLCLHGRRCGAAAVRSEVPLDDWAGNSAIVFRQPTRKQDLLRPVWGRLVFETQVSGITGSAIHLDAQDPRQEIRWSPSLAPDEQKELSALAADGHRVARSRRWWSIRPTVDSTRTTQLYRTLLHEIGHHVDWRRTTPELYFRRPLQERERSAHRYAMTLRAKLEQRGAIRRHSIGAGSHRCRRTVRAGDSCSVRVGYGRR